MRTENRQYLRIKRPWRTNEQGLAALEWPQEAPEAAPGRHGSCDEESRPLTQGKEAHMRDERMNATPLRLRTPAAQSSSHGRTLAEELIRKARLATAMHLALQAEQRAAGKHTS